MSESELDRIRKCEAKQRGVMWPDMLRQSRSIDEFLWRGDRKAKPIQRAALVLHRMMFLFMALVGSVVAWKLDDDWGLRIIFIALACLFGAVSVRFMRNAFRH